MSTCIEFLLPDGTVELRAAGTVEAYSAPRWQLVDKVGDWRVSTVFLPTDHGWGDGPPVHYETMVFPLDSYRDYHCERYCSRAAAKRGHAYIVAELRGGVEPSDL